MLVLPILAKTRVFVLEFQCVTQHEPQGLPLMYKPVQIHIIEKSYYNGGIQHVWWRQAEPCLCRVKETGSIHDTCVNPSPAALLKLLQSLKQQLL